MKIIVYDPLYSTMGHFYRYNRYILELLSSFDFVSEIIYVSQHSETGSFSKISSKVKVNFIYKEGLPIQAIRGKRFMKKISLHRDAMRSYSQVIEYINHSDCDYVFFTSQGLISFWLSAEKLNKKYFVSVILIKWLYDKFTLKHILFYYFFKFLKKATLNYATELYYKDILVKFGIRNVEVLHDRYLFDNNNKEEKYSKDFNNDILTLLTLGTISKLKNPIEFINILKLSNFSKKNAIYKIHGKSVDETGKKVAQIIQDIPTIEYSDRYITNKEYKKLLAEVNFVLIPYGYRYTKFATSGVMWDCFEAKKAIICPDREPFRHYINYYGIGLLYKNNDIEGLLQSLIKNKNAILKNIQNNYNDLLRENSFSTVSTNLRNVLVKYKILQ